MVKPPKYQDLSINPLSINADEVTTDEDLIDLWLHGKAFNTVRSYRREVLWFLSYVEKSVFEVKLADVQAFATYLQSSSNLSSTSVARTLAAVRSFLSFGNKIGVLYQIRLITHTKTH